MKAIETLQNRMDLQIEKLTDYLDRLSARERILVIFTTIFVLVTAVRVHSGQCIRQQIPSRNV